MKCRVRPWIAFVCSCEPRALPRFWRLAFYERKKETDCYQAKGGDVSIYSKLNKTFLLSVVLNKTIDDSDWRFDNLFDNHNEFCIVM